MTVTLKDVDDRALWSIAIEPQLTLDRLGSGPWGLIGLDGQSGIGLSRCRGNQVRHLRRPGHVEAVHRMLQLAGDCSRAHAAAGAESRNPT